MNASVPSSPSLPIPVMAAARFLELTLADGEALDIPGGSITMFEGMGNNPNETMPEAKAFIRYSIGNDDFHAWIKETFSDILRLLDINVRPGNWLLLTRETGDRVAFLKDNIIGRQSIKSDTASCEVTVLLTRGGIVGTFKVQESRDEIKAKMDQPATSFDAPPPGLIEQPVPGTPAAKPAPRPRQRRKA